MKLSFVLALERYQGLEEKKKQILSNIVKYNYDGEQLLDISKELKGIQGKINEISNSEVNMNP